LYLFCFHDFINLFHFVIVYFSVYVCFIHFIISLSPITVACHFNCGNPENKCPLANKGTSMCTHKNPSLTANIFLLGFCNCCYIYCQRHL
jgi:hypothetical protein